MPIQPWPRKVLSTPPEAATPAAEPLLPVARAWTALRHRTGIPLSRATFYRWVSSGKVYSLRMGLKVYVPSSVVEGIVKQCHEGMPLWSIGHHTEDPDGGDPPGM